MAEPATTDELRNAIETTHHCLATFKEVAHVVESFKGKKVWEGDVSVFEVDHPDAKLAYAWADPVASSMRIRFFAVLGKPPVTNANQAVQAAIVARYRNEISR